jgi:hypothetical protein
VFTLLLIVLVFFNVSTVKASSCNPGNICTFPTPNDPNYRFNMIHAFQVKGDSWTIKNGETVSFNDHWGDFTSSEGYLYASGIVGGGLCDVASIVNHVLVINGLSTQHSRHIIGGVFYPVMGVPDKDTVVIYDYYGKGPSGKDLVVTNNTGHNITLRWIIDGTNINLWVELDGSPASSIKSQSITELQKSKPQTFTVEGGLAKEVNNSNPFFQNVGDELVILIFRYRSLVIGLAVTLLISIVGQLIYSSNTKKTAFTIITTVLVFTLGFTGVKRVLANSDILSPPREASGIYSSPRKIVFPNDSYSITPSDGTTTDTQSTSSVPPLSANCSLPGSFPQSILRWCAYIDKYANQNGLDPKLVASVMVQESGGDDKAISKSGAIGLLQVMPRDGLAAGFMCINGPCFGDRPSMTELYDPEFNIQYGSNMLAELITRNGSVRDGLKSYGPRDYGYTYADLVLAIYNSH